MFLTYVINYLSKSCIVMRDISRLVLVFLFAFVLFTPGKVSAAPNIRDVDLSQFQGISFSTEDPSHSFVLEDDGSMVLVQKFGFFPPSFQLIRVSPEGEVSKLASEIAGFFCKIIKAKDGNYYVALVEDFIGISIKENSIKSNIVRVSPEGDVTDIGLGSFSHINDFIDASEDSSDIKFLMLANFANGKKRRAERLLEFRLSEGPKEATTLLRSGASRNFLNIVSYDGGRYLVSGSRNGRPSIFLVTPREGKMWESRRIFREASRKFEMGVIRTASEGNYNFTTKKKKNNNNVRIYADREEGPAIRASSEDTGNIHSSINAGLIVETVFDSEHEFAILEIGEIPVFVSIIEGDLPTPSSIVSSKGETLVIVNKSGEKINFVEEFDLDIIILNSTLE